MSFAQISTSVTIINSGLIGYMGISLTDFDTSALSAIASGSGIEIAGAFFKCDGDLTINASSWTAITTATTCYLALTPSGTAGSQIITATWEATEPEWSSSKQGWYISTGSNIRVVGSAYKFSPTQQELKTIYTKGQDRIFNAKFDIGVWDMDSTSSVDIYVYSADVYSFSAVIKSDAATSGSSYNVLINEALNDSNPWGFIQFNPKYTGGTIHNSITLGRIASLGFDSTSFDDTAINRGYVTITYKG